MPKKDRQHVRLAEDSVELGLSDLEDGFHASMFTLESESQDLRGEKLNYKSVAVC